MEDNEVKGNEELTEGQRRLRASPLTRVLEEYKNGNKEIKENELQYDSE